ncbi:MAG: DUF86 domain-containing protein [Candidatus Thermoplasmatota archaeon]
MKQEYRKRILLKLDDMTDYVEELETMLPSSLDKYVSDLVKRRACEKTVEAAIETLIDVAMMIVSSEKMGLPHSEENIFDLLEKNNILDKRLSSNVKKMKGFRNILIHRYANVDDELVYNNIKRHLDDFYDFEKEIKNFLKNNH